MSRESRSFCCGGRGSGFGHLFLLDATFKGTTGLGPLNQKLIDPT
jgi:hypothetical protein